VTAPEEPPLTPEERDLFHRGADAFNRGDYFECHDLLEELWSGVRGPSRSFFQGLIQLSVAFHHLQNGNIAGARSLLLKARARLDRFGDSYFGFDLAAQRDSIDRWLRDVAEDRGMQRLRSSPPRWVFPGVS
jgi:predicted metal-dependent hydrolase